MRKMFKFNLDGYVPFCDRSGKVFVSTSLIYVPDSECFLILDEIRYKKVMI